MSASLGNICYISIDLETSGPLSHKHFVTEIGAVAFTPDGTVIDRIQFYLQAPEGKTFDEATLKWYKTQPGYSAWKKEAQDPNDAMEQFSKWIGKSAKGYKGCTFVAYPTIFDGTWLVNAWHMALGKPPGRGQGFMCLDIRSFAAGKLGISVFDADKKKALKQYLPSDEEAPHTHRAVDDALEQGLLFFNIARA